MIKMEMKASRLFCRTLPTIGEIVSVKMGKVVSSATVKSICHTNLDNHICLYHTNENKEVYYRFSVDDALTIKHSPL